MEEKQVNEELSELLKNIKIFNQKLYDGTAKNSSIDFSTAKKNWGTEVIPEKFLLAEGTHSSIRGYEAVIESKVLYKDGIEMTFPLKGYVMVPNKRGKPEAHRTTWTLDGRTSLFSKNRDLDLVHIEF